MVAFIPILIGIGALGGGYLLYRKKEEVEARIGTVGSGLMFIVPGVGLMYAGTKLFPKEKIAKTSLLLGGVGLTGIGSLVLTKPLIDELRGYTPPSEEEIEGDIEFPVKIIEPDYGERWSTVRWIEHDPEVEVTNPTDQKRKFWVGFSLYKEDWSKTIDLPPKEVNLHPHQNTKVLWKDAVSGGELESNGWKATAATWNMFPSKANIEKGLKELGRDTVPFTARLIGVGF